MNPLKGLTFIEFKKIIRCLERPIVNTTKIS